jgi:hypothetical protein
LYDPYAADSCRGRCTSNDTVGGIVVLLVLTIGQFLLDGHHSVSTFGLHGRSSCPRLTTDNVGIFAPLVVLRNYYLGLLDQKNF